MKISGIGTDIVSLARFHSIKNIQRVAEYILTDTELENFKTAPDKIQYLGSRFSAKEAVIKAFPEKLTYHDFYITKDGDVPVVKFVQMTPVPYAVSISISHEFDNAIAFAIVCSQ